jgi:hypothetical protein
MYIVVYILLFLCEHYVLVLIKLNRVLGNAYVECNLTRIPRGNLGCRNSCNPSRIQGRVKTYIRTAHRTSRGAQTSPAH